MKVFWFLAAVGGVIYGVYKLTCKPIEEVKNETDQTPD